MRAVRLGTLEQELLQFSKDKMPLELLHAELQYTNPPEEESTCTVSRFEWISPLS